MPIYYNSQKDRSILALPRGPSGVFWLLFLLFWPFFLDLVGFLQGNLTEPLGEGHASGSGRVSDGQSHHVLSHELRQLHTAKLSLQLTGQLEENTDSSGGSEHVRSNWHTS